MELFYLAYEPNGFGGWSRVAWPDGRSTLDQPSLGLQMFSIIMKCWSKKKD